MTYPEALNWLYTQLPMYQRQGGAHYKIDLDKTWALMDHLDHPELSFESIHVAGTNGKGSTAHMMAAALQANGLKVGLYTSPHLVDFRERIRVNGCPMSQDAVLDFVEMHRDAFTRMELSFFEMTVGMAFDYFRSQQVDVAIVEVGMGGRLDSTNVLSPVFSVITNIGLDHQAFLGDTREAIASEKAGIIKPFTPVFIGEKDDATRGVFERTAQAQDAPLFWAESHDDVTCDLRGSYQRANLNLALTALTQQEQWPLNWEQVLHGLQSVATSTGLRGRWETWRQNPTVIADVAHNADGLKHAMAQWQTARQGHRKSWMIIGSVNDKNPADLIKVLPESVELMLCQPRIPRAMPLDQLTRAAHDAGRAFDCMADPVRAYRYVLSGAHADDIIYVGGSTLVVADILGELEAVAQAST